MIKTGDRFERLVALRCMGRRWLCECDCGKRLLVSPDNLKRGQKSCGCIRRVEKPVKEDPIYTVWASMLARAKAAGVTVQRTWVTFKGFRAEMGPTWTPGARFVRKDRTAGFNAENCGWRVCQR